MEIRPPSYSAFANGTRQERGLTEPIIVHWKNDRKDSNFIKKYFRIKK
jgi:hypothetical protein